MKEKPTYSWMLYEYPNGIKTFIKDGEITASSDRGAKQQATNLFPEVSKSGSWREVCGGCFVKECGHYQIMLNRYKKIILG